MKSKYKALVAEVSSGSFDEYIELLAEVRHQELF
jgi:hypothetical protein